MNQAPHPACWRGEDARAIFVTEALEGGDAVFLATHSPIAGFQVEGRDAADINGCDEQAVLEALSDERRRHAFCVIQGEPGSGKSHLIRWLAVNWTGEKDVKLLLRRADGSLEGALRQLKERLGPEFESLFDNLGQRHRAAAKGRANIFASTLADTLQPDHFDKPMGDEDWCRTYSPADLLGLPAVKQAWGSPGRILALLEGGGGHRDSATASFNLEDVEALVRACASVKPGMINIRAQDLLRRLDREADTIRTYQREGWRADELARDAAEHFPTSLALIDALNRRRNDAIQNVLGVSSEALKTLFRTVREKLAERGERLVLLLEDITSWEGLDDSLIDVLVFNAEARGDEGTPVCPLISVVGVTPEYYHKLQANYRQRITHEIILGTATEGLQDVAALRDPADRRRFAVRYLAAVRAGPAALERWREGLMIGSDEEPPNVCGTCARRPQCFATFGEEAGTGLFPFTAHAFERLFDSLNENDRGQTWRTPRGILQAILYPSLAQPEAFEARRFPTPLIESKGLREDRRTDAVLSNRLEQIVSHRGLAGEEEERLRRTLAYWGEPARSDTWDIDGEAAFAGVKRSLFEAFGIDWIGDDQPSAPPPAVQAPSQDVPQPAITLLVPDEAQTGSDPVPLAGPSRTPAGPRPAALIIAPKPKRLAVKRSELEQLQVELRGWAKGGAIANPNQWNRILYELVEKVDTRLLGVPRPLFLKIVTTERVKLQGSTGGLRDYLLVEAAPWVRDGLEAYIALKLDRGMTRSDAEFHRTNLAVMLRRLEGLVATYLARRLPRLESGAFWSPAAALAQILIARAWLRGTLDPRAPLAEHLRSLLSDEAQSQSEYRARSQPWQDWLNATDSLHAKLRVELRSLVGLGSGESGGAAGLIDASEIVGAIERLRHTGRADEVPESDGGLPEMLKRGRELAAQWVERRHRIDRTEAEQLKTRAESLRGLLRGLGIAAHLARMRTAVERVARLMPSAAPDSVGAFLTLCARAEQKIAEGRDRPVEELVLALSPTGPGLPPKASERLGWMAAAPARDLQNFLEVANAGEKLVETLYAHVRDCVLEASGAGSLEEVHAAGAQLKVASGLAQAGEKA